MAVNLKAFLFLYFGAMCFAGGGGGNRGWRDGRQAASQPTTGGLRVRAQLITLLLLPESACLALGKHKLHLEL